MTDQCEWLRVDHVRPPAVPAGSAATAFPRLVKEEGLKLWGACPQRVDRKGKDIIMSLPFFYRACHVAFFIMYFLSFFF